MRNPWLAVFCAIPACHASQFLIVTRAATGVFSFAGAESISVNGKDKLRASPLPAGAQAWDPKSIGHLAEARLGDFTVVRRAADGAFIARTAAGAWQLLLPEGAKSRAAEAAAQIWKETTVEFRKDRKEKAGEALRPGDLYAIVPGLDPGASAAALATDIALAKLPGLSDGDAFLDVTALLPAAAKAFPTGPPADRMRLYLSRGISDRLKTWREGDAPVTVLDESAALASAAGAAFPSDADLAKLRADTQSTRQWLDRRAAILRALDAGKQSDAFLIAYRDFEPFDKSFEALAGARKRHMTASAATHLETARELQARANYPGAIRHLLIAKWRDPKLAGVDEFLEQVRLEAARLSARKFAEARRKIDPRSATQVQLQRKLLLAEQYLSDGKQAEAESSLHEAESLDSDEPRIALLHAKLAVARGDLGRALAMLDNYAGSAPTQQDFEEGEKLRASVLYNLQKERARIDSKIPGEMDAQRFSGALEASAEGLRVDNESPGFLYYAGVSACILRNCDKAAPLLERFLDITESTQGNRAQRIAAIRMLAEAGAAQTKTQDTRRTSASWFSGVSLDRGVFYDPVSLSFQPKVQRIEASEHVSVNYDWNGAQLRGVHTRFEEKKTGSNIAKVLIAGAAATQGIGSTVGWRTPDKETNDFYFSYYDDFPQIMKVSRDNVIEKSRTIPISIPGMGAPGLGPLGGLSLLGGLSGLASMRGLMGGGMAGIPGGMAGLGGGGGGIGSLLRRGAGVGGMAGAAPMMAGRQFLPQKYSIRSDPQGGSSAGYLSLWNNPRVDTRLAFKATGKRAAVGFSGNRFFHPFAWDGIHLFELDYDEGGRVLHAWELGDPRAQILDFTWEGQRLVKVTGREGSSSGAVVYTRQLNYSGDHLTSESISFEGKGSKIEYKYDKQGRLVEADCEADRSLDGRSRKVYFLTEEK